jgi:hypothetical protein
MSYFPESLSWRGSVAMMLNTPTHKYRLTFRNLPVYLGE